jgi:hypothetical protein
VRKDAEGNNPGIYLEELRKPTERLNQDSVLTYSNWPNIFMAALTLQVFKL